MTDELDRFTVEVDDSTTRSFLRRYQDELELWVGIVFILLSLVAVYSSTMVVNNFGPTKYIGVFLGLSGTVMFVGSISLTLLKAKKMREGYR